MSVHKKIYLLNLKKKISLQYSGMYSPGYIQTPLLTSAIYATFDRSIYSKRNSNDFTASKRPKILPVNVYMAIGPGKDSPVWTFGDAVKIDLDFGLIETCQYSGMCFNETERPGHLVIVNNDECKFCSSPLEAL